LEGYVHRCLLDNIRSGKADETMKKLALAIEQFSRIA
jgi:hypothetical protein